MRSVNYRKRHQLTRLRLENLEARRLMSVYADFNGDGFDDLAIGVPGEDSGAGTVQVLYGSASGLTATGSQSWTQGALGTDATEAGDNFGASLAAGDFNNDGRDDLAVGVPGEDVGAAVDAGAVHIILGSATGLTGTGDKLWHQDSNRVRDISEADDHFGSTLAAGDFNGDGLADLAIGTPGEDFAGTTDAGMVQILYGAPSGLVAGFNPPWTLADAQIPGSPQALDNFGLALATADFNGDGFDDLAVGAPNHDEGATVAAGAIFILHGSSGGITASGSQLWDQETGAVPDVNEDGDFFGYALAAGDFNGDGRADLAIGVPFEDVTTNVNAGAVILMDGTASGLTATGSVFITQGTLGGTNLEQSDFWSNALTSGDFDDDGFDDLAVSAPGEDIGAASNTGVVNILFGAASGIVVPGNIALTQESLGGTSEDDDRFGDALGVGDYNGDGKDDIAIGTPDEDVGAVVDAGSVYVGLGGTFGGAQTWHQDVSGIFDTAETGDGFGGGLDNGSGRNDSDAGNAVHLITAADEFIVDSSLPAWLRNRRRR